MCQIIVKNLGKAYKHYPNRWARLKEWIGPMHQRRHQLQWILEDINFSIREGEAVGIIGINGAGKSTLLKLITGTTKPTTGSVEIKGQIAALLELGMGFHPDFTGRQNVYMAGQLLGLNEKYIDTLMPEIEAFAEIGDYIDQPVRVYSSGMQVRLAFSVATAHRPDVLIIDEALSVGDAYFQHKSFERIRKFRREGTTLLIVSHDKQAMMTICDRAILLSEGRLCMEGSPQSVIDYYNALVAGNQQNEIKQTNLDCGKVKTVSGNGDATILNIRLLDHKNLPVETISVGDNFSLEVEFIALCDISGLTLGFAIKDRLGNDVFGTNTAHLGHKIKPLCAGERMSLSFSMPALFGEGSYSVSVALHAGSAHSIKNYEWKDLALVFNVINFDKPSSTGVAWLPVVVSGVQA